MRQLYAFTFFCYVKWFDRQAEYGDAKDESRYYAWALISLLATSLFIALETALAIAGVCPFLICHSGDGPLEFLKYAWTFPIFLTVNFIVFFGRLLDVRYITTFENLSDVKKKRGFVLVTLCSILVFGGSLWLTLVAP